MANSIFFSPILVATLSGLRKCSLRSPIKILCYWLAFLFFCGQAPCQESSIDSPSLESNPRWNLRFDSFQILIQQSGMQVTTDLDQALLRPTNSVIVLIGNVDKVLQSSRAALRRFVSSGGKIIIAADVLYPALGFGSINPGPATIADESLRFQGFADCIQARDLSDENRLTAGLREIVTNRPGWIEADQKSAVWQWESLLRLPEDCRPLAAQSRSVIAIGRTTASTGTVILVADPSIFSNGMIWYSDNANLAIRMMQELSNENRTTVVIAIDGRFQSEVIFPNESLPNASESSRSISNDNMPPPPLPDAETILQVANAALQELANPGPINQSLQNRPRRFSMAAYTRWAWITIGLLVIVYAVWRLIKRSTFLSPIFESRRMRTALELQGMAIPIELQNKMASETLAREFCRIWSGRDSDSEWRICLDQLRDSDQASISKRDRVAIESMIAIAIFGGKSTLSNPELMAQGEKMRELLQRYRSDQARAPERLLYHSSLS